MRKKGKILEVNALVKKPGNWGQRTFFTERIISRFKKYCNFIYKIIYYKFYKD